MLIVVFRFALTGEVTGLVLALAGAGLIFLGIFDEGDLSKIIKAVVCICSLPWVSVFDIDS